MKAKEYVKKYKEDLERLELEDKDLFARKLKELLDELSAEIGTIMKQRNTESNQALVGVLNELDMKWKAISSKISLLSTNGFRSYIKLISPETLALMNWKFD